MPICFNCGYNAPEGKEICSSCGKPFAGDDLSIPPPPPAAPEPPKGKGFSSQDYDAIKTMATAPKKPAPSEPSKVTIKQGSEDSEDSEESSETVPVANIIKYQNESELPLIKRPKLFFLVATLLLLPALVFPWYKFVEGAPIEAFKLPVLYLFINNVTLLPQFSVGAVIAVIFAGNFILSLTNNRIVTIMQTLAVVLLVVSMGTMLLGLRNWYALKGLGEDYTKYATEIERKLPTGAVLGPVDKPLGAGTMKNPPLFPVGRNSKNVFDFFVKTIGAGALFAFLSSVMFLWTSRRFAPILRNLGWTVSPTIASLIAVPVIFLLAAFLMVRIAPVWFLKMESKLLYVFEKQAKATEVLERCVNMAVPNDVCRIELARTFMKNKNYGRAKEALKKSFADTYQNAEVHAIMGDVYSNEQDYGAASVEYRFYLKRRPADMDYKVKLSDNLINLGNKAYEVNDYGGALGFYQEADKLLEKNRKDGTLQFKIADALYKTGDLKGSLKYYKAAAALSAKDFTLQMDSAKKCEEGGDFEGAIVLYKNATEANPKNSESFLAIANIYRDALSQPDKAAEWYQKAIDANDTSATSDIARKSLENLKKK